MGASARRYPARKPSSPSPSSSPPSAIIVVVRRRRRRRTRTKKTTRRWLSSLNSLFLGTESSKPSGGSKRRNVNNSPASTIGGPSDFSSRTSHLYPSLSDLLPPRLYFVRSSRRSKFKQFPEFVHRTGRRGTTQSLSALRRNTGCQTQKPRLRHSEMSDGE